MNDQRHGSPETHVAAQAQGLRNIRRLTAACFAMAIVSLASMAITVWSLTRPVKPAYFAVQPDGGILPIVPLQEPFLDHASVINFGVEAITRAFTMSFSNFRTELTDVRVYFTPDGYKKFTAALADSNNLSLIRNNRMTSRAVANGAVIIREGVTEGGFYVWELQIPLTITYESAAERRTEQLIVETLLRRIPTWQNASGIAVELVVAHKGRRA